MSEFAWFVIGAIVGAAGAVLYVFWRLGGGGKP
jgi:hypothetical protein